MANEYADLGTLKRQLGLDDDDDSRDASLEQALNTASRSIDKMTGRRYWLDAEPVARVYRPHGRTVVEDGGTALVVDDIGSTSGLVVETGSAAAWSVVTTWETLPDNALVVGRPVTALLRSGGWGSGTSRVRVTARFGWPAVPDEVVQATLIQANRLFKRKDSPEGVTGSADWGVVRLSRRDPDVWNLIEPYVLPGFG
ncbi:phage gp6-like head-tail connector protein [Streptomyces sp. H27-H5]|uniref:phage gp6-like head-tail connector protein n=1 Tax=Streptomyces sp. H27-H5 TaxID=2996460 RepID=UPI00226D770B|nr:phage gp6-like head-tail connector protein [Streptomyces sp. H27-H5]MCY0962981.1 phage gp6-like head-tail connector protein [Streptomyces sp. H27-H5]